MTYYKMIDISSKKISYRRVCVFGTIHVGKDVLFNIKNKKIDKGDPLILAEIAGINAIKNAANLVFLCHPIGIENAFFHVCIDDVNFNVNVYAFVFSNSKTGVEIEAMFGVLSALLTIYDLTKKINPFSSIYDVRLLFKDGGESGSSLGTLDLIPLEFRKFFFKKKYFFESKKVFLITISDRASFGRYDDISGSVLLNFFLENKCLDINNIILPDDKFIFFNVLKNYIDFYLPNIVITSGGTGISNRDITFDVVNNLCYKIIPGIGEFLRINGSFYSNNSWLSRSVAGIYKNSLIVSLPGKPSAVLECLSCLSELLVHAMSVIDEL